MDRHVMFANVAHDVRMATDLLARASNTLVEHRYGQLSAKLFELELDLIDAHNELLEIASDTARVPRFEEAPSAGEDAVPF